MGNPIPENPGALDGFKLDISHQEMDRIIGELEAIYQSQPTAWLPVESIGMMLTHELGYEDLDEFHDALKCTFSQFLESLPHIEIQEVDGKEKFRVKPPPPPEARGGKVSTLRMTSRQDLWRVCLKSPNATASIPEIEFEIGADSKRHIDSVYNHVAGAIFNLSQYVSSHTGMPNEDREKIAATVDQLSQLLDMQQPWTWVISDPDGMSEFKPSAGVEVTPL
uniref:ZPR1 jelly-roll domain-containing protein n=1 Tax=Pyramimonas obovata TaxID=1411642 RepID=A0A7S0QV38_9CHLO|mmetsp:Transcript_13039/g.27582  ORF Transcript_13039/g.27582 Transcript_13039/m.27582 type:complete len:222 (+) Transcript_13039:181-846(+)